MCVSVVEVQGAWDAVLAIGPEGSYSGSNRLDLVVDNAGGRWEIPFWTEKPFIETMVLFSGVALCGWQDGAFVTGWVITFGSGYKG